MKYSIGKNSENGFTLLELVIAIFMFSAVVAGLTSMALFYFQNSSFTFEELQGQSQAQTTLIAMLREIREARDAENGEWTIVDASDTSFTFFSDVTNDGKPDRVRYFVTGTELKKGVIQPTPVPVTYPLGNEVISTIVSNIDTSTGPLFTYYNGDWPGDTVNNPLPLANRILETRFVTVKIRVNVNPGTVPEPFELESGVAIRSMKTNL